MVRIVAGDPEDGTLGFGWGKVVHQGDWIGCGNHGTRGRRGVQDKERGVQVDQRDREAFAVLTSILIQLGRQSSVFKSWWNGLTQEEREEVYRPHLDMLLWFAEERERAKGGDTGGSPPAEF